MPWLSQWVFYGVESTGRWGSVGLSSAKSRVRDEGKEHAAQHSFLPSITASNSSMSHLKLKSCTQLLGNQHTCSLVLGATGTHTAPGSVAGRGAPTQSRQSCRADISR